MNFRRMLLYSVITGTIAGIFCAAAGSTSHAADVPRSSISVLVDLSETWHNDASRTANQKILQVAAEAVTDIGRQLRAPVHIRYLPIGDASLLRPPLCEALYDPKLISGAQKDARVFTQEKQFVKYLSEDCVRWVLSRPKEKFTDITGAINSVAKMTAIQAGNDRIVLILSDMVEDRPKNQNARLLSLAGIRAVIIYRTLREDRINPAPLEKRLGEWERRMSEAGAEINLIPDESAVSGQISKVLRR
jgi:hypothetical protein